MQALALCLLLAPSAPEELVLDEPEFPAPAVLVFDEPGFPAAGVTALAEVPGARALGAAELARELDPSDVLVWRHGAAFPAELWGPLVRFLEGGGALLHLGGEPFTRPATGPPGARVAGERTVALARELRLGDPMLLAAGGAQLAWRDGAARALGPRAEVAVLEPRFADTRDAEHEDGASGARDALLRPLAHLRRPGDDPRFPFAAACVAIDRLQGRFAGGRWVLWLASEPPAAAEVARLVEEARREPIDLRVDPTFGCFHPGERPSVLVRAHRPRALLPVGASRRAASAAPARRPLRVRLDVSGPGGQPLLAREVELAALERAGARVELPVGDAPGLYRVRATPVHAVDGEAGAFEPFEPFETGFWVFDAELFASGDELAVDPDDPWALSRAGAPEPVVGTTLMSPSVQRKFLLEPNAAEWDDAFAELASVGVNLVRTGLWSGWRTVALDPGVVDEGFLRALEAYYLTARRRGLPVLFTLFAFSPEAWGGESPWLDPRARAAQRAFAAALAERFRGARELLWDLVNEPSFANPERLWIARPNGDRFERAAFRAWLAREFADDPAGRPWEGVVRARWRLRPDEAIDLPLEADFGDRWVLADARPFRALDWLRFSQDAFAEWAADLRGALRDSGVRTPVTVGQDEGGLLQRPAPALHAGAVDFTSMHTWWFEDALLADALCAKVPGKPLLVSETGIMRRELLSGAGQRGPDERARLLERKLGLAFAGGAFGAVEWCLHANPFMDSDNEAAIGLVRADGSYTPEHAVLRAFAGFFARHRGRFAGWREPDLALVFPDSQAYTPRDHATGAVRALVDAIAPVERLRVVHEYATGRDLVPAALGASGSGGGPNATVAGSGGAVANGSGAIPDATSGAGGPRGGASALRIVLPPARGIADTAWGDLVAAVRGGAELATFGWLEADDAELPAERLGLAPRPLALFDGGARYPLDVTLSARAADLAAPERRALGAGSVSIWPAPLPWARDVRARDLRAALGLPEPPTPPGVALHPVPFRDVTLVVAVNESAEPARAAPGTGLAPELLPPGSCRLFLLDAAGALIDRSHAAE